jgi:Fe-S-cluster containining protein
MPNQTRCYLSVEAAIASVDRAFRQYPGDMNLLSVLWPVVFGDAAYLLRGDGNPPVWAKMPGEKRLIPSREDDLKRRMMERLKRSPPSPRRLARIASLVFGVHAEAGTETDSATPTGIWIDTDMADFVCIQCGHCCLTLDYREGCTLADYGRWQDLGRNDILDWVGTVRRGGQIVACRIWMVPGTNDYAPACPWLKVSHEDGRYACSIHDVRPTVCRQYPGSRKHARLTGCKGV